MEQVPPQHEEEQELKPPIFGEWRYAYAFVLGFLVLLIILFIAITLHYA